jgi:tyrosine-specific transport protein
MKFSALAALLGTIIGAGILGIPFVVMKSGFSIGIIHLAVIGIIMALVMLYLGEIIQRTKSTHQLAGYAQKYLGSKGKKLMFFAVIFGIFSALLAYLIAEGNSLSYLIFNSPNYAFLMGLLFWLALSIIAYFGIDALKKGEAIGMLLVFATIILISIYFTSKIDINNLKYIVSSNFFIPFGVILFAYLGFSALPEISRILSPEKKSLQKIIILAYAIVFIVYAVFTAIVLGYKGAETPEIATIALGKPFILLGMITMFNAYLALSMAMIDTLKLDFNKTKTTAWLYTAAVPMILFGLLQTIGQAAFTKVIGIGGAVSGGIAGILILLMIKKAKARSEIKPSYSIPCPGWLAYILMVIFALGALAEIIIIL